MEKAILTIASAAALCLAATAAVQPGENILENGTFACDQMPFPPLWSTSDPDACRGHAQGGPDGLPYLSITGDGKSKGEAIVRQYNLTLAEGGRYRISARVRTRAFESKNAGVMVINGGWSKCAAICHQMPSDTAGKWVSLTNDFTCFESWRSNYTAVVYAVASKGVMDVADFRLEALDGKALAHSAKAPADKLTTVPRLVPMTPLLWKIPEDDRRVTFRFFGRLPEGTAFADCEVVAEAEGATTRTALEPAGFALAVPGTARAGRMAVRVANRRTGEKVWQGEFAYRMQPRVPTASPAHRRLNNLCTEVLREKLSGGTGSWSFVAPRDGWIYIAARGKGGHDVRLDGQAVIDADTPRGETFRRVQAGEHRLAVTGPSAADVIVRAIAEIFAYPSCVNGQVGREPRFDWDFNERYVLPAVTSLDGGFIPETAREGFRRRGYRWYENTGTITTNAPEVFVERLVKGLGMNAERYDGVALDEHFFWNPRQIDNVTRGIRLYDLAHSPERLLRFWICGKPGSIGLDHDFLSAAVNASRGNGRLMAEVYGRTAATEAEAVDLMRGYATGIVKGCAAYHPHAVPALAIVLGNFFEPGVISLLHHPEVDPKRFLDVEVNFVATDPSMSGIGGIGWWGCNHTDDEFHRWSFVLMRHYVVEGRTDLASDHYGFAYLPNHLVNGDFRGALAPWRTTGDVRIEKKKDFASTSEGRFGIQSDIGDHYAVLTKANGVAAEIRQTAKGLVPGRLYCLQFATFDADDVQAARTAPRRFAVEAVLEPGGAEIDADRTWVHVDRRQKGYYATNSGVARINVHHIVFRALKPEVAVTLSAAAAKDGERLGVNWLSLNPYFSRELQGDAWWEIK